MQHSQVLIIGGGPSGMVSALCLAQWGVSSIIIERNDDISEHPKAHELNARSIEILEQLGISDSSLAERAAPFSDGARILFCNTINEKFGRIDLYADEDRRKKYELHLKSKSPYLNISQTEIEKVIRTAVVDHPLIKLLYSHEWQSLKQKQDGVDNVIWNKTSQKSINIHSDFVIAADGASSPCRKFLGINMTGPDKIQDFVSAYFETNLREHVQFSAKLYWIFNPYSPGTFIAHHIEKRWVFMIPIFLKYQKKEDFTKSFFEEQIKLALGDKSLEINVESINFWRMSAQLADTYRKGKVLLVGDAAHRFPPTGGLGMNTGIADAHNVCWKLAKVIQNNLSIEFLDSYELERKPIAAQNSEESVHNFHKIFEVMESFGLNRNGMEMMARIPKMIPFRWLPHSWTEHIINMGRRLAASQLNKFHKNKALQDKVRKSIADQVSHFDRLGLDIGYIYETGALIPDHSHHDLPESKVSEYSPTTSPGARFPYLDLSSKERDFSTHDFFDYQHFTLLIREDGRLWKEEFLVFDKENPSQLRIIDIDDIDLLPKTKKQLIELCQIDSSGAIIIRPDGHIAFRKKRIEEGESISLTSRFDKIFQLK